MEARLGAGAEEEHRYIAPRTVEAARTRTAEKDTDAAGTSSGSFGSPVARRVRPLYLLLL